MFYKPEVVGLKTLLGAVFPFAYGTYWYFTAYFCLFFFTPFLNLLVEKFEKTTLQNLLASLFFVFSLLPTLFHSDFAVTKNGYSFLWLAVLYIVGAYIKKHGVSFAYKNSKNLYGYIICVLLTWLSRPTIEFVSAKVLGEAKGGDYLIAYTSPTIVLCAVFLLLFFANLKCGKVVTKFIGFFAPVSFGVYLWHCEPLTYAACYNVFVGFASLHPFVMVLAVIGSALCIWLAGSLIDKVRLMLFNMLKLKEFSLWIENKLRAVLRRLARLKKC